MSKGSADFIPLNVALMTVSDRHSADSDSSGSYLHEVLTAAGHHVFERALVPDNRYRIRALVSSWIASQQVQVVLINGGTGFNEKNCTPEAIAPLFDREVEGFGELFRMISWEDIATSTLQSRALAGIANGTLIFAMPGSGAACQLAWQRIIQHQLDARTRPCHFVSHLKKP